MHWLIFHSLVVLITNFTLSTPLCLTISVSKSCSTIVAGAMFTVALNEATTNTSDQPFLALPTITTTKAVAVITSMFVHHFTRPLVGLVAGSRCCCLLALDIEHAARVNQWTQPTIEVDVLFTIIDIAVIV